MSGSVGTYLHLVCFSRRIRPAFCYAFYGGRAPKVVYFGICSLLAVNVSKLPGGPTPRTDITNPASHVSRGAAVKTRAFGEVRAIKKVASKSPEDAEMASEDPSNGQRGYLGRE